ncbi:integrase [Weissella uvarum]|uniref:site-specific integrase n=1 Tax=Weissella uvarum TaxID=1479233 RepID=UPI001960EC2A|nr:site-specific integrase [Weissella uvarum]MBM7616604.1 integrase [Weissella uvarum]MCM0594938.1 tyrosine-type recombinase/integrase [Weissella uvarum]
MAITKKKNGKYQVRVYVGYDHITGKRKTKYATCETMREARLKEAQLITDVETGELVPEWDKPKVQQHYTFDEAFEEWFDIYKQQGFTQSTVDKTEQYFKLHLLQPELFGGMYLERMTRKEVQDRVNVFLAKYVTATKMLGYASQVFKYAVDSEHIKCDENPLDHIRKVRPKKAQTRKVKYYNEGQAQLFEAGFNEYYDDKPMYKAVYTVLLRTGMRIGELLGLQWQNVDFANNLLTLNGRMTYLGDGTRKYESGLKNGDGVRVIEIDKVTHNKLKDWHKAQLLEGFKSGTPIQTEDFVFPYARTSITNSFYRFQDWFNKNHEEQLPHLNLHGLRHTHASLLISDGVELKKVAERLGHKDITITANIYADVTPKARREVADKFSEIMAKK